MTKDKAKTLLDNLIGMVEDNQESDYDTALKMGIQALSQEPTDTWSIKDVADTFKKHGLIREQEPCEKPTTEDAIKTIQELMIACTPDSKYYKVGIMAISAILENEELSKDLDEALKEIDEYERGLEQEPCTDAVSRQAVLEMAYDMLEIDGEHFTEPHMIVDVEDIQKLPPVTQKSGKWIIRDDLSTVRYYQCSECNEIDLDYSDYCPNCGCRMVEPQERSDKE